MDMVRAVALIDLIVWLKLIAFTYVISKTKLNYSVVI